jgi:hypothetical protein
MTQLAASAGHSKEWTTAALLGQMSLTAEQAGKVGALLELPAEAVEMLQVVPYKGSLPTTVPTDPIKFPVQSGEPRLTAQNRLSSASPWSAYCKESEIDVGNLYVPSAMLLLNKSGITLLLKPFLFLV